MNGSVPLGWLLLGLGLMVLRQGRRAPRSSNGGAVRRRLHRGNATLRSGLRLELIGGAAALGLCWALLGGLGVLIAPVAVWLAVLTVRRAALPERRVAGSDPRHLALLIDLVAGALEAGLPIDRALTAVADAAASEGAGEGATGGTVDAGRLGQPHTELAVAAEPLGRLGRLLSLGAEPEAAWGRLAAVPNFAAVATAGRRCAHSGARLAQALRSAAEQLRDQRHADSVARADRCGVWVLLPPGLCFLPAFVCLGIAPTILGVARGVGMVGSGLP